MDFGPAISQKEVWYAFEYEEDERRGRVYDNIFVERLWRSIKYEEVYLHDYQTVPAARSHLSDYFEFYNNERPHEALGYRTPHEVYFGTKVRLAPASAAVV